MNFLNATSLTPDLEADSDLTIAERGRRIGDYLKKNVLITDGAFDRVYPAGIAEMSRLHWTPVHVAAQAAAFLSEGSARRVLDVGSGCGKFCAVASLVSPSLYTGVDRSADLTAAARQSAADLRATGCEFIHGNAFDLDWSRYNGFYFFNPFDVERESCVERTRIRLRRLPAGTRVVTYFGFGDDLPGEFKLVKRQSARGDCLDFWVKAL